MQPHPLDNSPQIAELIDSMDAAGDDTFWYIELLDRSTATGSGGKNRLRIVRSFDVRSGEHLLEIMPTVRHVAEATESRAYMRLSPRSRKQVAFQMLNLLAEVVTHENYGAVSRLYSRACGTTNIKKHRLWLYDVDEVTEDSLALKSALSRQDLLVAVIPSRQGQHLICKPHDPRTVPQSEAIALHKDNPTNLYAPVRAQ